MNDRRVRIESLLREIIARYVQREANTDPLITIMRVATSPDYRRATAYFTSIPSERDEDALIFLKRSAKELRTILKKESNLKIIPHLEFAVDYGERHRQHIDEIAKDL